MEALRRDDERDLLAKQPRRHKEQTSTGAEADVCPLGSCWGRFRRWIVAKQQDDAQDRRNRRRFHQLHIL